MYISQKLAFKQQTQIQSDFFENISVDFHESFLIETENMLTRLDSHKAHTKIFMSDLNFGNIYCKFPILSPKPLDALAPELFSSHNYQQLIDIPTRVTANTTSLIDLIFTNNVDNIQSQGTLPPIADHKVFLLIFIAFKLKTV